MNYTELWYQKKILSSLSHFETCIFFSPSLSPHLYDLSLVQIKICHWEKNRQTDQNSVLPKWYVRKKILKLFLQWQSNAADCLLGARIYTLTQNFRSSVKRFQKTPATHSSSSTISDRPNSRLCAFGHTTCHKPSALSLLIFSLPASTHLSKFPDPPPWDPSLSDLSSLWRKHGKFIKAASTTETQTLYLCSEVIHYYFSGSLSRWFFFFLPGWHCHATGFIYSDFLRWSSRCFKTIFPYH